MPFSQAQTEQLLRPVNPRRVQRNDKGMSHLAAYDVSAHLTRIFGFGGWRKEILALDLVAEDAIKDGRRDRLGWYVTYRCTMRLHVGDWQNDDGATGSASNLPDRGDAHDFAMKNAISYALKRCAKDLGDQFGLSLYNKGSTDPLVIRTLTSPMPQPAFIASQPVDEDVPDLAPDWDEQPPERDDGRHMTSFGLSRTGVPDEDLAANGEMTREQVREHDALNKTAVGKDGKLPPAEAAKVERVTITPPDDPFAGIPGAGDATPPEDRHGTATTEQIRDVNIRLSNHGLTRKAERLAYLREQIGHEVFSSADLSFSEAAKILRELPSRPRATAP